MRLGWGRMSMTRVTFLLACGAAMAVANWHVAAADAFRDGRRGGGSARLGWKCWRDGKWGRARCRRDAWQRGDQRDWWTGLGWDQRDRAAASWAPAASWRRRYHGRWWNGRHRGGVAGMWRRAGRCRWNRGPGAVCGALRARNRIHARAHVTVTCPRQLGIQAACYETSSFLDGGGCSNIAPAEDLQRERYARVLRWLFSPAGAPKRRLLLSSLGGGRRIRGVLCVLIVQPN